jgi:hypothetical protein
VLTAVPDPGYRFAGWSGDVTGTANPETVVVLRPLQTVATFERIPPPKLALKGVSWDADGRSGLMSFTSSGEAPVLVEIFDLAGRRRASLRLEGLTAGAQETRVATDPPLGLGVFFARISQGSATARRSFPVKR